MPVELTPEEQELVRQIVASLGLPDLFSFKIRDGQGNPIAVEGITEFFSAPDVLELYKVYAKAYVDLYKVHQQALAEIERLTLIAGRNPDTFRKTPVRPILVSDVFDR